MFYLLMSLWSAETRSFAIKISNVCMKILCNSGSVLKQLLGLFLIQ